VVLVVQDWLRAVVAMALPNRSCDLPQFSGKWTKTTDEALRRAKMVKRLQRLNTRKRLPQWAQVIRPARR